ncbi:MAG: tRNA lysidine(34) synthetase TilS [Mariprofundus sp.]|nr:tRNA lysidine(34) synthetase TilS [Mariprofundus sp.]
MKPAAQAGFVSLDIVVSRYWLAHADVPELPHRLAVGWSGGADSTALLLALKQLGHDVQAWHVDHAWRDSSEQEAESLSEKASAWAIPFLSARLQMPSGKNREAEARKGRLAQFQNWQRQGGITTLCLGQHRQDQAETVCMRLLQGAGAGGCRGMSHQRQFGDLRIVRPLLHVSVQDLKQALLKAGIEWFEDPSNSDLSIWRNRIRHQLFPAMQQVGIAPDDLFLRWQRQADVLMQRIDDLVNDLWRRKVECDHGRITLPWSVWLACSAPVRARLLQRMVNCLHGGAATPGRRHIELVELWTQKNARGGLDLSRCRLYRRKGSLHLQSTRAALAGCDSSVI